MKARSRLEFNLQKLSDKFLKITFDIFKDNHYKAQNNKKMYSKDIL
jgi:hypothetical protein